MLKISSKEIQEVDKSIDARVHKFSTVRVEDYLLFKQSENEKPSEKVQKRFILIPSVILVTVIVAASIGAVIKNTQIGSSQLDGDESDVSSLEDMGSNSYVDYNSEDYYQEPSEENEEEPIATQTDSTEAQAPLPTPKTSTSKQPKDNSNSNNSKDNSKEKKSTKPKPRKVVCSKKEHISGGKCVSDGSSVILE